MALLPSETWRDEFGRRGAQTHLSRSRASLYTFPDTASFPRRAIGGDGDKEAAGAAALDGVRLGQAGLLELGEAHAAALAAGLSPLGPADWATEGAGGQGGGVAEEDAGAAALDQGVFTGLGGQIGEALAVARSLLAPETLAVVRALETVARRFLPAA